MKLYKFYSVNKNSISCLVNKYVWYTSPKDFNDPFDTAIIDSPYLRSINFNHEKILCLTAINNSPLMWSHYGDGHRGFCIEFTDYSDEELDDLRNKGVFLPDQATDQLPIVRNAKPVQYKSLEEINAYIKSIPLDENTLKLVIKDQIKSGNGKELEAKIHNSSFIKHLDWDYEKEYRLINTTKNIVCLPGKITAIYFGIKMSSLDKRCVGMIVNPEFEHQCSMYQMHRPLGTFSLTALPFDPKRDLADIALAF